MESEMELHDALQGRIASQIANSIDQRKRFLKYFFGGLDLLNKANTID
jgi:hypothetical protein